MYATVATTTNYNGATTAVKQFTVKEGTRYYIKNGLWSSSTNIKFDWETTAYEGDLDDPRCNGSTDDSWNASVVGSEAHWYMESARYNDLDLYSFGEYWLWQEFNNPYYGIDEGYTTIHIKGTVTADYTDYGGMKVYLGETLKEVFVGDGEGVIYNFEFSAPYVYNAMVPLIKFGGNVYSDLDYYDARHDGVGYTDWYITELYLTR